MCPHYTFEAAQSHLDDVFLVGPLLFYLLGQHNFFGRGLTLAEDDGKMEYVATEANMRGAVEVKSEVKRVEVRAGAIEVRRDEAILLQERAQQLWPDSDWEIEKTYSGKYVVRSYQ